MPKLTGTIGKLDRIAKKYWKMSFDKLTDYQKDRTWDLLEKKKR